MKVFESLKREDGFTMIEMIAVFLILAILFALALFSFLNQVSKAQDASAQTYLSNAYKIAFAQTIFSEGLYPDKTDVASNLSSEFSDTIAANSPEDIGQDQLGVLYAEDSTVVLGYRAANDNLWILSTDPLNGLMVTEYTDAYTPPPGVVFS